MAGECAPPKQRGDAKSEPRFGPDRTVDSTTSTHARYVDMTASSRAASTSSLDTRTYVLHAQAAHPSVAKVGYDRRCNCAPNAGLHTSPLLDLDLIPLTPVATARLCWQIVRSESSDATSSFAGQAPRAHARGSRARAGSARCPPRLSTTPVG